MKRIILFAVAFLLVLAVYLWWQNRSAPELAASTNFLSALSDEQSAGFTRALEPNAIEFPRDLGAHDDYKTEWWYYTGNLTTTEGREFGFQLTFFRTALKPPLASSEFEEADASDWRFDQIYFAHFTISDIDKGQFYEAEQFSREAAGLAGAQADPYHIWLNNWSAEATGDGRVRLYAQTDKTELDLMLTQTLPPILHGEGGLSQKGEAVGNASYYYSFVQQQAEGTVKVGDESFDVTGKAWKDHEYSTSVLEADAIGWDWFSLQFDNGAALMLFEIRRQDGSLEPWSSGSFITADGTVTPLSLQDWEINVNERWRSPDSGAVYPNGWRIRVPDLDLDITGKALMPNQELNVSTTYWEGAVGFEGTLGTENVTARGYIEMTGYAGSG